MDAYDYWEMMQHKVCRKCIDGDGKGNCRLPAQETCPVQVYFPEIVHAVTALNSGSYEDYLQSLRQFVCTRCRHQLPDGTCQKRTELECALNRYYPLIVDVIESVRETVIRP